MTARRTIVSLSVAIALAGLASVALTLPALAQPTCTITGTDGPDEWQGASFGPDDVVCGLGGDDFISGTFSGTFSGGPGWDGIDVNAGTFYGGDDEDMVSENRAGGIVYGGPGIDIVGYTSARSRARVT